MITEAIEKTGVYHLDRNTYILGGEPMIFHCHHYNVFLQMSIEDTKEYIDVYSILIYSAQEVVFHQFSQLFATGTYSVEERKQIIQGRYRNSGFGLIDLSGVNADGGVLETPNEHYAVGWKNKFGLRKQDEPGVCFFTRGFLSGALEAVYDLPLGTLGTEQTKCLTKGDDICRFEISQNDERIELSESPGEGIYQTFDYYPSPEGSDVDYGGIREALTNMPIVGSEEDGLIDAFGVLLTRHYANYYNLISLRTMLTMEQQFGAAGVEIVKELLTEAGHVCAFNTLGGIMLSAEWNAMIKPMVKNRDDWTHGIVACANAMGWGFWEIMELQPNGSTDFKITSSYESNAFLKLYGKNTNYPACCFLDGALAGVMNLIYHGDITKTPTLDEDYYVKTFKSKGRFISKQIKARTMGDPYDEFRLNKLD